MTISIKTLSLCMIFCPLLWKFGTNGSQPTHAAGSKPALLCSYQLKYQPDSTSKVVRKEYFKLAISEGSSRFQSPGSRSYDSLVAVMTTYLSQPVVASTYIKQLIQTPPPRFRYSIYKHATGPMDCYDWISSKLYHYQENPAFNWVMTPKKATVAGYTCQQATTSFSGRKYEAWFTREIPVSDGPYKFRGLPGLIVKITDSRNQYDFELVSLTKSSAPLLVALPSKATSASRAAIRRGQEAYQARLEMGAAERGASAVEVKKAYARSHNNAIEIR